jgi:CPA2 family monovalent cation:H+ antiporter-2
MPIGNPLLQIGVIFFALFLGGLLAQRLRQALAPIYILAGLAVRPLVGNPEVISLLSTLGVVLLMFMIGLQFSLPTLLQRRRAILGAGLADLAVNFPLGCALGWMVLGAGAIGSLVWGGIIYATSSAIVCKSIIDLKRSANPETEHVLSVLVFEDLAMALLVALCAGVASGGGLEWGLVALSMIKALAFCAALIAIAVYAARLLERLLNPHPAELGLMIIFSFIIVVASLSGQMGLSEALGGFLAGLMVSTTRLRSEVEQMISPFQQLFAALFFVAFGLSIRFEGGWRSAFGLIPVALLMIVVSVLGKLLVGGSIGLFHGLSGRASFRLGMTLTPRGEFSVVLAGLAAALPREGVDIPGLAALYVLMMSVLGAWMMRDSDRIHARLDPFRRPPVHPSADRGLGSGLPAPP